MAIFNSYVNLPEGTPKKNVVENQHVAALNDKIVYCHIKHWCPQDWLDYQPVKVWIQPTNQVGRWNSNGGEYSQKNRKTAGGSNMFTFHGCVYIYIWSLRRDQQHWYSWILCSHSFCWVPCHRSCCFCCVAMGQNHHPVRQSWRLIGFPTWIQLGTQRRGPKEGA